MEQFKTGPKSQISENETQTVKTEMKEDSRNKDNELKTTTKTETVESKEAPKTEASKAIEDGPIKV